MLVEEIFVPIVGYEGLYEISNTGKVKSCKKNLLLKQHDDGRGYLFVNLSKNGKAVSTKIHRLVATHFLENPNGLRDVNHKDEDKHNNMSSNLEWASHQDNINHGTRNLRANDTKSKEVYQLTKEDVLAAKFKNGYEAQEVTKIKESSISACCNGRRKTAGGFKWSFTYVGSKKE